MIPISARARRSTGELVSIESISTRASWAVRTGGLPFFTICLGPRTEPCRVLPHHLGNDQVVKEHPGRGELELHRGSCNNFLQALDIGRHMHGGHLAEFSYAMLSAPGREGVGRARVGFACVGVLICAVAGTRFIIVRHAVPSLQTDATSLRVAAKASANAITSPVRQTTPAARTFHTRRSIICHYAERQKDL